MASAIAPLPRFEDVRVAAERLKGRAVRTPLLSSTPLDGRLGARVLVKAETLQRTGSFKFRGAYNAVSGMPPEARAHGVVASSSGNHAQGLAAAAAAFGVTATIVMPGDAPALKRRRTEALGARIVLYDRATEDRDAIARAIADNTGAAYVAAYDDPYVIAGQGTAGLELAEQAEGLGAPPDLVLVPCGGGGLTAGITLALTALLPDVQIYTVEPEGFDDHARSFRSGRRERNTRRAGSVCDSLLAEAPGVLTFAVNGAHVAGGLTVSDEEALAAVSYAWHELKLVVEPGGAVALAALLSGRIDAAGKTVAVVLSGGNPDPAIYSRAVSAAGFDRTPSSSH